MLLEKQNLAEERIYKRGETEIYMKKKKNFFSKKKTNALKTRLKTNKL